MLKPPNGTKMRLALKLLAGFDFRPESRPAPHDR
jgi:hypothetical protein